MSLRTLFSIAVPFTLSASLASAVVTVTAVGVYDSTSNGNAVEASAVGDYTALRAGFESAFVAGTGGIINFDNNTGTSSGLITVTYGGGSLNIGRVNDGSGILMNSVATIQATPISGSSYYRLGGNPNGFNFSTPLSSFGFTVLSRSTARNISVTVTYSDLTTYNLISAYSVGKNTAITGTPAPADYLVSDASGPDTFFGFQAPEGKYITSITISGDNPVIDDFGFVTVPEPSVSLLGIAGLAGFLIRRRRA